MISSTSFIKELSVMADKSQRRGDEIATRLRKAGMVQSAGRRLGASYLNHEGAAILLLAFLGAPRPSTAVELVRVYLELCLVSRDIPDFVGLLKPLTLGNVLVYCLTHFDDLDAGIYSGLSSISVCRNWPEVIIGFNTFPDLVFGLSVQAPSFKEFWSISGEALGSLMDRVNSQKIYLINGKTIVYE